MNASIEKYLKAYNLIQLSGWGIAFLMLWINFQYGFFILWFFQIYALTEVVHASKKWVQASPLYCFLQTAARILILFFSYALLLASVFKPFPWINEIVLLMLTAWCIAEIIRYGYYVSNLMEKEFIWLTRLRYSAFILLYPLGAACECYILYLVFHHETILWIKIFIVVTIILYVLFFPKLYLHLIQQRKKKLNHNNS